MTKAAALLGISQSAASAAIRALEQQHGVQLFNRVGRNIELAQTGRRFLPEAKAVLERAAAASNVLEDVSQTVTGSLSIAASQTAALRIPSTSSQRRLTPRRFEYTPCTRPRWRRSRTSAASA